MKERIKLKTTNIRGNDYVEVKERIRHFREEAKFEHWSLETEIVELSDERVVLKAIVRDPSGRLMATGLAYEKYGSSKINQTSYIENCETSAWGRALANMNIGISSSIASSDEVESAINLQAFEEGVFDISENDHKKRLFLILKKFRVESPETMKSLAEACNGKIKIKDLPDFIQSQI